MADVEVEEELPERVNSLSGSGPGMLERSMQETLD